MNSLRLVLLVLAFPFRIAIYFLGIAAVFVGGSCVALTFTPFALVHNAFPNFFDWFNPIRVILGLEAALFLALTVHSIRSSADASVWIALAVCAIACFVWMLWEEIKEFFLQRSISAAIYIEELAKR